MFNPLFYTIKIKNLEVDIKNAFQTYMNSSPPPVPMILLIEGDERIPQEFVDYMVIGIDSVSSYAIALVKNDLFIQFLVSSINLRCQKAWVKAFQTSEEAIEWLELLEENQHYLHQKNWEVTR